MSTYCRYIIFADFVQYFIFNFDIFNIKFAITTRMGQTVL